MKTRIGIYLFLPFIFLFNYNWLTSNTVDFPYRYEYKLEVNDMDVKVITESREPLSELELSGFKSTLEEQVREDMNL